jgi:hypothetical protein
LRNAGVLDVVSLGGIEVQSGGGYRQPGFTAKISGGGAAAVTFAPCRPGAASRQEGIDDVQ